jgi:hypothetical protein
MVAENKTEGVLVEKGIRITHILFVDDILLLGNKTFTEWKVFKEVLDLFCKETRMDFSPHKSLFLGARWLEEELFVLKEILLDS